MSHMPDEAIGVGFLEVAKTLCPEGVEAVPPPHCRRAISSAYYALFHALASRCANVLVGNDGKNRSNRAWVEVYRGLDHGNCARSCQDAQEIQFPQAIKDLAQEFRQLQALRQRADYDPTYTVSKENAMYAISLAENCIKALDTVKHVDMVAFAAWLLITTQGAKNARQATRRNAA